jgi:hypothetical protein
MSGIARSVCLDRPCRTSITGRVLVGKAPAVPTGTNAEEAPMAARRVLALAASLVLAVPALGTEVGAADPVHHPAAKQGSKKHLLTDLGTGGFGSTVGPGGDLFVTEPTEGKIVRVDRRTGHTSTYARGLPEQNPMIGLGGVTDVVFRHHIAYALVTLVSSDVGGSDVDGIYRILSKNRWKVVADIGTFATNHPPKTQFDVPSGVQFAMVDFRRGWLVTDGHHNRVYQVGRGGHIRVLKAFRDIVPTGLDLRGGRIYMAEAGPVPHLPADGKVVRFRPHGHVHKVAAGARLLTDVEWGGRRLYAVSQGHFTPGHDPGTPADPGTGSLVRVRHGSFVRVARGLDRPTSVEIVHRKGYVVTLPGRIIRVDHLRR